MNVYVWERAGQWACGCDDADGPHVISESAEREDAIRDAQRLIESCMGLGVHAVLIESAPAWDWSNPEG